jgi:hypothetical protein
MDDRFLSFSDRRRNALWCAGFLPPGDKRLKVNTEKELAALNEAIAEHDQQWRQERYGGNPILEKLDTDIAGLRTQYHSETTLNLDLKLGLLRVRDKDALELYGRPDATMLRDHRPLKDFPDETVTDIATAERLKAEWTERLRQVKLANEAIQQVLVFVQSDQSYKSAVLIPKLHAKVLDGLAALTERIEKLEAANGQQHPLEKHKQAVDKGGRAAKGK